MQEPYFSSGNDNRVVSWLARWGVWAAFAWGLAEATLFFIIPDVIVGAVSLFQPRRAAAAVGAAIGGAMVGGVVLVLVAQSLGPSLIEVIEDVPGIPREMVTAAQVDLDAHGGAALLLAPLSGTPYKIYAAEWGVRGWGLPALLAWTIPARALRLVPVAVLAAGVGLVLRRNLVRRPWLWLGLYGLIWTGVYVLYFRVNGF